MAFNYSIPVGSDPTKLFLYSDESEFLNKIDNFSYPLNGFGNLAQLHNTITVELSDDEPKRKQIYRLSEEERASLLKEIDAEMKLLKEMLEKEQDGKKREILLGELEKLSRLKKILEGAVRTPDGEYEIIANVVLLGLYVPKEKKVILYINAIRKRKSPYLLGEVYVHEMMHAYLDHCAVKEYFDKIEEPIAEYGMLKFFDSYNKKILADAKRRVRNKQDSLGLAHYGFGYCIFMKHNGVDFLDLYYKAKPTLTSSGNNMSNYLEFWKWPGYPQDDFMCLVMLYLALNFSVDIFTAFTLLLRTRMVPTAPSKTGKDYSKYTINGSGPYAKSEAALLAVCKYISDNPTFGAVKIVDEWRRLHNFVSDKMYTSVIDHRKRDRRVSLHKISSSVSEKPYLTFSSRTSMRATFMQRCRALTTKPGASPWRNAGVKMSANN